MSTKLYTFLLTKARQQRRVSSRRNRDTLVKRIGWATAAAVACTVLLFTLYLGWLYSDLTSNLPSVEQIPAEINAQSAIFTRPTRLLDASGTTVLAELTTPGVTRQYIRIKGIGGHVSQDYLNALIAVLEPDFWTSNGFTWDMTRPDEHPTIAQRLVFDLMLSTEKSSRRRAIRERILAAQLVSKYGRERVLEWFINSLNNGNYAYGVDAAAKTYFGKSSAELTLPEAAILAGTAAAPALNPWDSPNGARALQAQVLKTMAARKVITPAVASVAVQVPVQFTAPRRLASGKDQVFINLALDQLEKRIGRNRLERGGLTVQTTLDANLQEALECTIRAQISAIAGLERTNLDLIRICDGARLLPLLPPGNSLPADQLSASILIMDTADGSVSAYVNSYHLDGTSSSRTSHPADNILYPAVYLNAFTQGLAPATLVWDLPPAQSDSTITSRQFDGPESIRKALLQNDPAPVAQVFAKTGQTSLERFLAAAGVSVSGDLSGGVETLQISELQAARLFNLFAAEGNLRGTNETSQTHPQPVFIRKVWDATDEVIFQSDPIGEVPVISTQATYLLTSILKDTNTRGEIPGMSSILETSRETAVLVKAGEPSDQAWTIGYTPQRTILVWMGAQTPLTHQIDPRWASGLWRASMLISTKGLPEQRFVEPAGIAHVNVCVPSGDLPGPDCPRIQEDVFLYGNEPKSSDSLYKKLAVNIETGRLATVFTPENLITEKVFLDVPQIYRSWAQKAGFPVPPMDYDVIRAGQVEPSIHISSPEMFQIVSGVVNVTGTAAVNDFAVYRVQYGLGLNPTVWQQIGPDGDKSVLENDLVRWDTTGLNGLMVLRLQVVDQDQVVKNAYTQVVVDNTPPSASILYPTDGESFASDGQSALYIKAEASDGVGISEVRIIVDGQVITRLSAPPFAANWQISSGEHILSVEAVDQAGNISTGRTIKILVK